MPTIRLCITHQSMSWFSEKTQQKSIVQNNISQILLIPKPDSQFKKRRPLGGKQRLLCQLPVNSIWLLIVKNLMISLSLVHILLSMAFLKHCTTCLANIIQAFDWIYWKKDAQMGEMLKLLNDSKSAKEGNFFKIMLEQFR